MSLANWTTPQKLIPPTDEEWARLLHPDRLDKAREDAEKERKGLDEDEIRKLQILAKTNLFFLAYSILGYKKLSKNLHGNFCKWLDITWKEWLYRITLLPRTHFKTTLETITDSIQIVLPDHTENGLPYPRNLGTEVRIMLGHETHGGSQRFLYEITGHFTGNPKLIALFPECVPDPRMQRINKSELELPRANFWAEPTFDTMGVGARAQGRHFDVVKLDDIFGEKARDSKTERETLIQWFDNIQAFLIELKFGRIDLVGTRYSVDDVYAHMMKVYKEKAVKYIRRIEEMNDETGIAEPIFPEHFTPESLDILRQNKKVWAAQYVNDPHEGLAEFELPWKRFYGSTSNYPVVAFTNWGQTKCKYAELDILVLVDPAVTKTPGIVVTGTDRHLNVFILEIVKKEMSHMEFIETIFRLVQTYWPRMVCIEEVVFSSVFSSWIRREQIIRNCRFTVFGYKPPPDKIKFERVAALAHYFSAGQIFFRNDQLDIIWEFDNFGATENYHLLDALAQGEDLWQIPVSKEQREEEAEFLAERLAQMDPQTGYSN